MRTHRQTKIRRAILELLEGMPTGLMLPDPELRADVARSVSPRPTTAELDHEISKADSDRLIVGVQGEESMKWKISDAGRAWLAENP